MIRKIITAVTLALFFLMPALVAVEAAGKIPVESFPYMSTFPVTAHHHSFFVVDVQPVAFDTMTPSLLDLRIYAGEHELGYVLLPLDSGYKPVAAEERRLEVINQGVLGDGIYSFTVFTGKLSPSQLIRVRLDQEPYLVKGVLYGSNDNRNWQKLKPVTLFSIDNRCNEISLFGIDYDYLKVDYVHPPGEMLAVREAWLVSPAGERGKNGSFLQQVPFDISRDEKNGESIITADLRYRNRVSSEWFMSTAEKGFHRQLVMEGSNNGSSWEFVLSTYIYRGIEPGDEKLSLSYDPVRYRYLRFRIRDEDNEPVKIDSLKVRIHPVRLLVKLPSFLEETPLELTAYWGNERVEAPCYDIGRLLGSMDIDDCPVAFLGSPVKNPRYKAASHVSWSERHPYLLPLGMIAAVAIIALILYRSVRQVDYK